jgi:acyl-[acyl-carrier-protein]-phospholipid O-acyltransferase/long-chain-fatty-acid--[acyl-carrier-protein] ligase
MRLPFKNSNHPISSFFRSPSWFESKKKHSLWSLNFTQFFGVINDNLYKLLMVFLLIETLGKDHAAAILSAAGAVYVIPFLIFSSSAGILADKLSKQKLIIILKGTEVGIMLLAIGAFALKSTFGCYGLLFLLATHSAMFGPSKYGIIPEIVSKEYVSRANSLITAFTYVAIILGTFLASFLTDITERNFVMTAAACLLVALLGFISSLFIKKTEAQGSTKKINPFFVREIYHTLQYCRDIKHLIPAITGSAFFLFIGAFAQLNIIPFAIQSLNLTEVAGGYLFLVISFGIAAGSLLCGRWTKKKLELGISCIAGLALSLIFILLSIFSFSLSLTILFLILLGLAGGVFVIPFDSFIQVNSPVEKRGQVIAATNFLSFSGVLIASIALYVFNDLLSLSPSWSFAVIGMITAAVSFFLTLKLSATTFPFLSRKIFFPLSKSVLVTTSYKLNSFNLLILENATVFKALLISSIIPDIHFLMPKRLKKPFWYAFIHSLEEIEEGDSQEEIIVKAKNYMKNNKNCCLLLRDPFQYESSKKSLFSSIFNKGKVILVKIDKGDDGYNKIQMIPTE